MDIYKSTVGLFAVQRYNSDKPAPDANINVGGSNAKVEEETATFDVMPGKGTASPMLGIENNVVSPIISRLFAGWGRRDAFDTTINAGMNDIAVRTNVKVEDETMTFHLLVGERVISTAGIENKSSLTLY